MVHAAPDTTLAQIAKLADLLEQASRLARKLSRGKTNTKRRFIPVPELKRPKHVPKDQEWFWSENWLAGEQEVNMELAAGLYEEFDSMEALIADLHAHV